MRKSVDIVLTNGHVIDPANGTDGCFDVAVADGKIVEVASSLSDFARRETIDVGGAVVSPGLIDLHVHVYQYITPFGLNADAVGIQSGSTTVVDQGSAGPWTFSGFLETVVKKSRTDVRSFLSVNLAGALKSGLRGDVMHSPHMVEVKEFVRIAKGFPGIICGIKCHGESGGISNWGATVLQAARDSSDQTGLPLYCHTGELFPVVEERRPDPNTVLDFVIPFMRAGDTMAHVYSHRPDGIMGRRDKVPASVFAAMAKGIHFDIGYGMSFSFDIARKAMVEKVFPNTISSDVHGNDADFFDDSTLNYSLCGAMTRLLALGMPLHDIIERVTVNPAKILRDTQIGSLTPGTKADVTVIDRVTGDWVMRDGRRQELLVKEQLIPKLVLKDGEAITPNNHYLRDLAPGLQPPKEPQRLSA
jgi:dihydroorotase